MSITEFGVGRRGPKPTGTALSNADRQRLKAHNSLSLTPEKLGQTPENLGTHPITEKLNGAFEKKDWALVLSAMLDLGYPPPPLDPDMLTVTYITSVGWRHDEGQTRDRFMICVKARDDAAFALVAWARSSPTVIEFRFNGHHHNFELVTEDPGTVLRTVYRAWEITEYGEVIVLNSMKYQIIPALLTHCVRVSKTRTERQHRKFVKAKAQGQWSVLSTQASGVTYHFELAGDAALARMFIEDEVVPDP
jgi:hypothetical protein